MFNISIYCILFFIFDYYINLSQYGIHIGLSFNIYSIVSCNLPTTKVHRKYAIMCSTIEWHL